MAPRRFKCWGSQAQVDKFMVDWVCTNRHFTGGTALYESMAAPENVFIKSVGVPKPSYLALNIPSEQYLPFKYHQILEYMDL